MNLQTVKLALAAKLIAATVVFVSPVQAGDDAYCGKIPRAEWKPVSEVASALEAKGYQVREIERDDGCYEVEARHQSGERVELYVNPRTLEIVKTDR
jgi:hypothetical protein